MDLIDTHLLDSARAAESAGQRRVVRHGGPRSVAPIPLDSLESRVAQLWSVEPQADPDLRSELLEQLSVLAHRIELLQLRTRLGVSVPAGQARACSQHYLRLREFWVGTAAA